MTKKESKKSRKKECSAFFPGQRTATPKALKSFIGIEVVMQDPASCYAGTMEALIFRLACLEDKEFESKAKKRCWKSLLSLDIVVYLLNSEQNDEV